MKLAISALIKYITGVVLVGLLLFLPAGALGYSNGWLFMGLLFVPMLILGVVLLVKSPKLLKKRLDAKEESASQKKIVSLSGLFFVLGFAVAGLDYRFGWSDVPSWAVITASAILLVSYGLYGEVMRENAFLSRTVEIQENQTVVDKGLYSIVRHPMYAVTLWIFLSIPLVLGSLWSFLCFLPYVVLIVSRINHEEKLLETQLNGYAEYKTRVKYRLFPFVW